MKTINPSFSIIADPYACALFNYSKKNKLTGVITKDLIHLYQIFYGNVTLVDYSLNPTIDRNEKKEVLTNILKSKINIGVLHLVLILLERNRIYLLETVIQKFLILVQRVTSVKFIEIITATKFTRTQQKHLIQRVKKLIVAKRYLITINNDPNLIGGILIKLDSRVLDFTVKNQLRQLAIYLHAQLKI